MPEATSTTRRTPARRRKPRRHELRPEEQLCDHCGAKCCRYFALAIDKPKTREDFDHIRWYLLHEQSAVFVEDKAWYLLVLNPCKHLGDDHRCNIYANRPKICRNYVTDNCEYDDDWTYELYWDTPEQVEQYEKALIERRKKNRRRRAKLQSTAVKKKPKKRRKT